MGFSGSWVGHLWISSRVEAIKSGIKLLCDFFKAIETVEAVLQRTAEKYTEMLASSHDCFAFVVPLCHVSTGTTASLCTLSNFYLSLKLGAIAHSLLVSGVEVDFFNA